MVRIINHGCGGHMGRVVEQIAAQDPNVVIVAGVDVNVQEGGRYPVYADLAQVKEEADVVIDFSTAAAVDHLLESCVMKRLPVVVCTTGLSEEQTEKLRKTSETIPVFKSANMSIGVNLLISLLKECSGKLTEEGFDVEITERHHRRKLDSPSGTALALADAVNAGLEEPYAYNLDRSGVRKPREKKEIGIVGSRGGTIVGEHSVIFAGEDEVIELKHSAYSRGIFARGAIAAARFLKGRAPGMYSMEDVFSK